MSTLLVQKTRAHTSRVISLAAGILIALPAVIFYVILLGHTVDIPLRDDYTEILNFLNHMPARGGGRTAYLLTALSGEFKLIFGHVVVWLQFVFFNHIDFRLTCALGNGFVLPLALVLWRMFLPGNLDLTARMVLFIPVTWILFQLQYIGTLNWAMPSLQYFPALVFSFYAIYLLTPGTRPAFIGAALCLVAAIASSGNGIIVIPIGTLLLASGRHLRRLAIWLAVSSACIATYAFQYNLTSSLSHGKPLSHFIHPNLFFILTFIGNAAELPTNIGFLAIGLIVCPLLGLMLCTFFVHAAWTGYFGKNRAVMYSILFLLTTAIGVGSMRSDLGVQQGLSSRYGINSALLLIFAWFVVAEKLQHADCYTALKSRSLQVAVALAVLFSFFTDLAGYRYIVNRNRELVDSMANYRRSCGTIGPVSPLPNQPASFTLDQKSAPAILEESIRKGIYHRPAS